MPPDGLSFSEETPPTDVRVGNYRIVRRIGQGGWGEVFEAHHVHGLRAAIKVLRAHVQATPGRLQRFFREAIAAGTIHHPGIVRVFDVGRLADGRAYILMELIRGESLRRHLQQRAAPALPLAHIISIGRQIASAMAAVHIHDIVHRDLKPENIMVSQEGGRDDPPHVKLVDFGIAKFLHPDAWGAPAVQTSEGSRPGTPDYMAPEQVLRGTVSDRTDVYALGLILVELCTGRPLLSQSPRLSERAPALPQVPPPLRPLVARMLAWEPQARPAMADIAHSLATLAQRPSPASALRTWLSTLSVSSLLPVATTAGLLLLCSTPGAPRPTTPPAAPEPIAAATPNVRPANGAPTAVRCADPGLPAADCPAPRATAAPAVLSGASPPPARTRPPAPRSPRPTPAGSPGTRSWRSQLDDLASKYERRRRGRSPSAPPD